MGQALSDRKCGKVSQKLTHFGTGQGKTQIVSQPGPVYFSQCTRTKDTTRHAPTSGGGAILQVADAGVRVTLYSVILNWMELPIF